MHHMARYRGHHIGALGGMLLFVGGCSTTTAPGFDEAFTLRIGESVEIADTGVSITFADVLADSRCPTDVECVWAGDAAVVIEGRTPATEPLEEVLHTHLDPKTGRLHSVELFLLQLEPYPQVTGPIPVEEYALTLVARLPDTSD